MFEFGSHEHNSCTKGEQVGYGFALFKNHTQVAVGKTASEMRCLLLIFFFLAEILDDSDQTLPIEVRKDARLLLLNVVTNGIIILEHVCVTLL